MSSDARRTTSIVLLQWFPVPSFKFRANISVSRRNHNWKQEGSKIHVTRSWHASHFSWNLDYLQAIFPSPDMNCAYAVLAFGRERGLKKRVDRVVRSGCMDLKILWTSSKHRPQAWFFLPMSLYGRLQSLRWRGAFICAFTYQLPYLAWSRSGNRFAYQTFRSLQPFISKNIAATRYVCTGCLSEQEIEGN